MGRIALIGENSIEYIERLVYIWNRGHCAVLLDWRIPLITNLELMKEARVFECYIDSDCYSNIYVVELAGIQVHSYESNKNIIKLLPNDIYSAYHDNDSLDEAVVIYSSGTTGRAKGVILSHHAISANANSIIDYMSPNEDDCIYTVRPLSHSTTLVGELLVALKTKCRLLLSRTAVPPRYILDNVQKYAVTILCVNPFLLLMLSNECIRRTYSLTTLRVIYTSGSILNDSIYEKAHTAFEKIKIYNVYGLTEAGPRVAAQTENFCKSNSVGHAIKGVEISIIDEKGVILRKGEKGIIHIKSPSLFCGYVTGHKQLQSLRDDWLNTGDLGYFDENNELHIIGRSDDAIIINSHKIYPDEIESKIVLHTSISECIVAAVVYKDTPVIACLYSGKCINKSEVRECLREILPAYEMPHFWIECEEIPKNRNGKISKSEAVVILKDEIANSVTCY